MKKIAYLLLAIIMLATTVVSCDVTRNPEVTPEQGPFKTFVMAQQNRDALYALLRGAEAPNNLNAADIQSDLYHLTFLDNNSMNGLYNWRRQSVTDNDFIVGYYGSFYSVLMQSNYFLWRAQELLDSKEYVLTDTERKLLEQYIGEVKVMRALAHWRLVIRFSKPWDGTTDNDQYSGIIQILSYDPIARASDSKSSRADVYKQAIQDLNEAIAAIPEDANKEVKPAIYITRDYANAVKARVCLFMQDWQGAVDAVNQFVNNYSLTKMTGNRADDVAALNRIWTSEDSDEIMVRLYATPQFGAVRSFLYAGGTNMAYAKDTDKEQTRMHFITPYLVLEKWVCDLYENEDVRKEVYTGTRPFYREDYTVLPFRSITKYEGNPSLNQDKSIREDKFGVHLFNVGEGYLIKAEALLKLGRAGDALKALADLRKARGLTTSEDDYGNAQEVEQLLRDERVRELVAEGWRLNDLLRWGAMLKRSEEQPEMERIKQAFNEDFIVHKEGRLLEKDPKTEQMFVWEFPTRDLENNTNLNENRNWK
ncbi:RagB/SusD family nutrient uptake outer membrane protein [Porphyromonas circumdentaria]|uniref:Starch-binding associating with outer membrane n=1 Tax=Porphyromonas circumdentaria TaxID=29524 RepID=A0A1T4PVU1_9PORP|nr:RagB/SusD family nutrient uptake outer membrane protein [Porphyromonas circumdentaria]MBB6276573.1 hypothetical protein [Porphyromonas circumdentaria]SJZ95351.1 Starch-binding associating with outer membrane [Porphyromonas circumdentaria]